MAMLKNKHITFSLILVCLIVVSPMAKAQLGLGGLLGGILGGSGGNSGGLLGGILGGSGGNSGGLLGGILGGIGGIIGGILNIPSIHGVLFCTHNGRISPNTAATPAFANADVQLQCGKQNRVISSTTTNAAGIFSVPTNSIQMLLSTLISDCKLTVTTPLTKCNATLPSVGNLVSPLTVTGTTVSSGVLKVINLAPTGFLHTA